jgi:hypothetical protein
MGKYEVQFVEKPVAVLTAWRGTLLNPFSGLPYREVERRQLNDEANRKLMANLRRRELSHYPVVGAGQEADQHGLLTVNKENSLVATPIGQMTEDEFIANIQELLFNPADEQGAGPFEYTQWGALLKVPSNSQAFILFHTGQAPTGPHDYTAVKPAGDTAEPRLGQEPWYTQMRYGPRADQAMMDPLDRPDDVGNPRPGTGKPGAGLPGKRFWVTNRSQP